MKEHLQIKLLMLAFMMLLVTSCGIDKFELDDRGNEFIPNYSISLIDQSVTSSMESDLIAIDDDHFLMAIETSEEIIVLVEYIQIFEEEWGVDIANEIEIGKGTLSFFNRMNDGYILGYLNESEVYEVLLFDADLNILHRNSDLKDFIDTAYNATESISFINSSYVSESKDILLGGSLFSQGNTYSCVVSIDSLLNPQWVKTYFEEGVIQDVSSINKDTFMMIHSNDQGSDLIQDNFGSQAYQKYNLSEDELYFGVQSFTANHKFFLSGIHNKIGRLIEIDLETNTTFINEVEIYPVSDVRAIYLSRNNIISAGIHDVSRRQFTSELGPTGSIWCHSYIDERYIKILNVIEMPGKGILISSIVERDGSHYIHLTRIDEEGATFINEYTENCI